jgi:hypothetical protein
MSQGDMEFLKKVMENLVVDEIEVNEFILCPCVLSKKNVSLNLKLIDDESASRYHQASRGQNVA